MGNRSKLVKMPFTCSGDFVAVASGGYVTVVVAKCEIALDELPLEEIISKEEKTELESGSETAKLTEKRKEMLRKLKEKQQRKATTSAQSENSTSSKKTKGSSTTSKQQGKQSGHNAGANKSSLTSTIPRKNPNIR